MVTVDNKELVDYAKKLALVPKYLDNNIERAFDKTADKIIMLAKTVYKPDIKYASGYRSGELNRSYTKEFQGRAGNKLVTEIGNDAKHFASVELGSTSANWLYGYFMPGWKTGSGKDMFIQVEKGDSAPSPFRARWYHMNPWKGYFMLQKATEDPFTGKAHEANIIQAIDNTFTKALGG